MDYYKILNRHECHHGLQYNTGLNIDPIVFNPSGDCKPGGIYFSREDILAFLNYGPWIRKVTFPEGAQIYENLEKPKKWKADKIILGEREEITIEVIKRLINEGADPTVDNNYPLRYAALNGYINIVKLLIPVSDGKASNNIALKYAAYNGHVEIVKLLIPVSNPKANNSEALRYAAEYGHTEVVKLLIPVSDPKANNSIALRWAARNNRIEIVKLLIPVSDPKTCNSEALRNAAENGHIEIVKLLIPVSDPKADNSIALRRAIYDGHIEVVKLLIPVSKINDDLINYCKKYCKNQEIYNLIISNKSI